MCCSTLNGVQHQNIMILFKDNLVDFPWVHNARSIIDALIERPPKRVAGEQQDLPTGLFKDVKIDCISDILMDGKLIPCSSRTHN
jgi:hypothetical protein